jgi:diguanylate cyclase (GGDEF)-like protein/PAS domain S-box-containing protein
VTQNERPATAPDAATILRSIGEVTYAWRLDTDALTWSDNAAAVLGLAPEEIGSGRAFAARVEAEAGQTRADALAEETSANQAGAVYQLQYALKRPDGDKVWLEDHGRWFAGPDGRPARAHGVVRVITTRYEQEQKLSRLARLDPLTGELNSAALIEMLTATLDETVRFRGSCGFLLVAIDHLRQINEAYGFDVAEDVIAKVAKRIRARLRSKDHLGRFSGNKFGVVLTRCTAEELAIAAERLIAGVRDETIATPVGPVAVTITIGGVNAPRHARTVPEIISRAQDALHQARTKRRGSFQAFQPSLERETMRRDSVRATDEIVAALNERRIALAYEPVVGAQNRALAFYECLMRVFRLDGQIAHANQIIPVAERVGLVRMLDHRVLELVAAELAAAPGLHASVNVSAASAVDPGWWLGLGAMLRANGNVAERLVVEITETAAIQDVDDARGFVSRVKDLGCRIAIDDFGAGHTSFRNLRRLGVDIVKIDGAFVQNIVKSDDDRAFVQTMIDLARRLGLETVAEWVQDEEAAALLAGWGCDYLQGSLIGLASTARPWLADNGSAAAS